MLTPPVERHSFPLLLLHLHLSIFCYWPFLARGPSSELLPFSRTLSCSSSSPPAAGAECSATPVGWCGRCLEVAVVLVCAQRPTWGFLIESLLPPPRTGTRVPLVASSYKAPSLLRELSSAAWEASVAQVAIFPAGLLGSGLRPLTPLRPPPLPSHRRRRRWRDLQTGDGHRSPSSGQGRGERRQEAEGSRWPRVAQGCAP
ncbi:hypothetical protein AAY473_012413 [Plecturocebus cupreus]